MVTGRSVWGVLTSGQVRWLITVTWGLAARDWIWLTSRIVRPLESVPAAATLSRPFLARSAKKRVLPSSIKLRPWTLQLSDAHRTDGCRGWEESMAVRGGPSTAPAWQ